MKKVFLFVFLLCSCMMAANAQKKALIKEIDESIQSIDKILDLPDAIIFSSGDDKEFDATDKFAFTPKLEPGTPADIQKFFDELSVSSGVSYPYSLVHIRDDEYKYLKLLGFESNYLMDHPDEAPVFRLKKIYFKDGSSMNATNNYYEASELEQRYGVKKKENGYEYLEVDTTKMSKIEREVYDSKSSFGKTFVIKSPKPVSKVDFDIDLYTKTRKEYTLNQNNNRVETPFGTIILKEIDGSAVQMDIPYRLDDLVNVQGIYKDGRPLRRKSSSKNTGFGTEDKAYYQTVKEKLNQARQLVANHKIKNKKELEQWMAENIPDQPEENKVYHCYYNFSGPVSSVDITVYDTALSKKTIQSQYTFVPRYDDINTKYEVAIDYETERYGIIDWSGKWLIAPTYEEGFRQINNYFFLDQLNDKNDLYWFDLRNKKLKKVNYTFKSSELYANRYMTTEAYINGPMGVVDAVTGEEKLTATYDYLWWLDGFWKVRKKKLYGLYDTSIHLILPFEFYRIEKEGDYFFTRKENKEKKYQDIEDIYNTKGENITKGRFQKLSKEFENSYFLVGTKERSKEDYTVIVSSKSFIIDSTGKVVLVIPPDKYYVSIGLGMHHGLFVIRDRKTNGSGFMNMQGKVVVPCNYSNIITFQNTAYVTQNGEPMLIDYTGKIVKKLPDTRQSSYWNKETGLYEIRLFNGERYNEKGEKVSDDLQRE